MNGARTPDDRIEEIISQAAAGERSAAGGLSQDDLKTLADRIDLLNADFGRWESYKAASTEYIIAFKAEVDWHQRIRLWVSIACLILVALLAAGLVLGIIWSDELFRPDQSHAFTALIVSSITGCVVVMIALVKGAFANLSDRNAGLPMPEHIKEIVEAAKNIVGGPSH